MALEIGIKGTKKITANEGNSAKTMGSGSLDVFATPAMVALVEETAWKSVQPYLGEGEGTVGTRVRLSHDAPTPLGMEITAETELIEVDGRRLVFRFQVSDEKGIIGKGEHERFIIQNEKFQSKADEKRSSGK